MLECFENFWINGGKTSLCALLLIILRHEFQHTILIIFSLWDCRTVFVTMEMTILNNFGILYLPKTYYCGFNIFIRFIILITIHDILGVGANIFKNTPTCIFAFSEITPSWNLALFLKDKLFIYTNKCMIRYECQKLSYYDQYLI